MNDAENNNNPNSKVEHVKDSIKDITAGSVRGIVQVFVGHPLDTVKIRLQSSNEYTGVWNCLDRTVKREGLFGLYKGASSPIFGAAFYSATLFFSYGISKKLIQEGNNIPLDSKRQLLAGCMTGGVAAFVEGPLDLFKSKMQIQTHSNILNTPNNSPNIIYKSTFDVAIKLYQNYGVKGFYQGFNATVWRNVPGSAVYFAVYEGIKKLIAGDDNMSVISILLAGGVGGMAFWTSIYPMDVIKTKIQTDFSDPSQRVYKGIFDCAQKIWSKEGMSGFWRGYKACLIRSFPVNACSFLAFESSRSLLGKQK